MHWTKQNNHVVITFSFCRSPSFLVWWLQCRRKGHYMLTPCMQLNMVRICIRVLWTNMVPRHGESKWVAISDAVLNQCSSQLIMKYGSVEFFIGKHTSMTIKTNSPQTIQSSWQRTLTMLMMMMLRINKHMTMPMIVKCQWWCWWWLHYQWQNFRWQPKGQHDESLSNESQQIWMGWGTKSLLGKDIDWFESIWFEVLPGASI